VLSEGGGVAVQILDKFKIDYVKLRRWIFTFIEEVEEYGGQVITQDRSVLPPSVKRKFDEWKKRDPNAFKVDENEDEYYDDTKYFGADGVDPNKKYKGKRRRPYDPWGEKVSSNSKSKKLPSREELAAAREVSNFRGSNRSKKKGLADFSVNLTSEAQDKLLDPVIGRDEEIQNLVKVLARRRKNNPVLVGEPGVGKTACAEGLAILMLDHYCPDFLRNYEVHNLDLGSVLAGTKYRGEFEERFKYILEDVQQQGNIILVIDEVHTIVGAGAAEGAVDAANLLKPALARGTLKMIGATTLDEYRKHIEKDPALERRFHPIIVEEPSVEITIDILKGLRPYYQRHHALMYEDEALEAAAYLSNRFITDRQLPDKAIDVIDECGSQVRLRNRELPAGLQKLLTELHATLKDIEIAIQNHDFQLAKLLIEHELEVRAHMKVLTLTMENDKKYSDKLSNFDKIFEKDITEVISAWTGVPVTKINESETERLKKMESILHDRLIGQHHAVIAVSKAVRRARTGIQDPKRPIASFIFAGPTGVGKTELTKALAEYIFDSEKNMIRFDMSEFMEKHTAAKLIGSPPGYVGHDEGGQLTDAVRRKPYSIVLFDEVEKAHPDIFNLFLQILDDGQLTDSKGKLTDFKNCIIVMTTNLGAHVIEKESPILPEKQKKSFGFDSESWEGELAAKESQKIDLMVNLDGTFTVKAPTEKLMTSEDEARFSKINELVNEELKKFFRPEFLNRVDDIIVFQHLSRYDIWQISGVMLRNLAKRLESQGVTIEIDNAVRFFLTQQGYDPVYGARPLRRAIIKLLEDELAVACLDNPLEKGVHIVVKQELNPNPVKYAEYFNDVYSDKIVVTFDRTNVQTNLEVDFQPLSETGFL
jgi:ATP-dependent Clp protease ATP-binding subunit ClpC